MQYSLNSKDGSVKHYEVSYSQILQKRTNKLLTILILLITLLLLVLAYTLLRIDLMDIPTKLIYGT